MNGMINDDTNDLNSVRLRSTPLCLYTLWRILFEESAVKTATGFNFSNHNAFIERVIVSDVEAIINSDLKRFQNDRCTTTVRYTIMVLILVVNK